MDPIDVLPDASITNRGPISRAFLARGWATFGEACRQVHRMPYGYNTTREDPLVLFHENQGSCTTKHMAAGLLAAELGLPIHKSIGIYAMTGALVTGARRLAAEPLLQIVEGGDRVASLDQELTVEHGLEIDRLDDFRKAGRDIVAGPGIEADLAARCRDLHPDAVPFPLGGITTEIKPGHLVIHERVGQHQRAKDRLVVE